MKKIIHFAFIISMCISMVGCGSLTKDQAITADSNVKQVKTEIAKKVEVEDKIELSALLQPMEEAILSFEVPGRILAIEKKESDNVDLDEIIARLDSSQYQINSEIANASLAQAEANLSQTLNGAREQEKESAKATYDKANAVYEKALIDFKRMESLLKEGAISKSDYENAQTRLTVSQTDMTAAKAVYDMALEGARVETKQMAQEGYKLAEGNSDLAKLALGKTQLKAPFKGTILNKSASDGQIVAAGTPVFRFGNIDSLKLILPVPDNSIDNWTKGDSVTVSLYGKEKQGVVTNILSATNVMTGTIGVEVTVQNNEHDWVPGQVAVCRYVGKSRNSIVLPVESIISLSEKNPYLFINNDGKAVKKDITLGELKDNKIQILTGLDEGSEVIVSGAGELFEGARVKVSGGVEP
ncbi:efflux RND transporter periplasmic adaptor subunit [Desulfosporosinus fructosivorans]